MGVIMFQGIFEIVGLSSFLGGYFLEIQWLFLLGGCLIVLDDIIEVSIGILNPIFPILLAVILACFITPWYVGIFWASGAFKILSIPSSIQKIVFSIRKQSIHHKESAKGIMERWKENSKQAGVVQRPLSKLAKKEKQLKEENK